MGPFKVCHLAKKGGIFLCDMQGGGWQWDVRVVVQNIDLLDARLCRRGPMKSLLSVCVSVTPWDLSTRSKNFSNFFRNDREEHFKNTDRARFLKKKIPGAPGVKMGDFHAKLYMAHYLYLIYSRSDLRIFFILSI